jgi:hypothetical protein
MSENTQEDAKSAWEDEGGASAPEPTQTTVKSHEIPRPKRSRIMDSIKKLAKPKKG